MKDSFSILLGFRFVAPYRAASRERERERDSPLSHLVTAVSLLPKCFLLSTLTKHKGGWRKGEERERSLIGFTSRACTSGSLHYTNCSFCTNNTQCNEDRSRKRVVRIAASWFPPNEFDENRGTEISSLFSEVYIYICIYII